MNQYANRLWSLLALAATTALLLSTLHLLNKPPLQAANDATQLRFEPATVDLTINSTVTVTVRVVDVQKLFGLEFNILYDPQRVTIESITPGNFLSADFVVKRTIDPVLGIAALAYTQIAKDPISGSGDVAIIVLRPTDCLFGTRLQLHNSILSNNDGVAIPHDTIEGTIQNRETGETRKLAGTIFHDINANGVQDDKDPALDAWPVFTQPSLLTDASQEIVLSGANGLFQFDNLACGTYALWSKNGTLSTPRQRIPILAASDVLTASLPITGSLEYPFQRLFLPGIAKSNP